MASGATVCLDVVEELDRLGSVWGVCGCHRRDQLYLMHVGR